MYLLSSNASDDGNPRGLVVAAGLTGSHRHLTVLCYLTLCIAIGPLVKDNVTDVFNEDTLSKRAVQCIERILYNIVDTMIFHGIGARTYRGIVIIVVL